MGSFVPAWDGIVVHLTWVTTSTNSFNIPARTGAVTFILPDFGTDTSCTVEALDPVDKSTWRTVKMFNPDDASVQDCTLAENAYIVVPASALGTGCFRLTNATSQVGLTARVIFDRI